MILRPQQIHLMRMGRPVIPANGGGSSESKQSTNTSTQLTNNVSSSDSRSVASDHAIALGGAGDSVTQISSTANTTSNSGNTSTALNSGNTNSGNTSFASTTNNTVTDFGSVQAALDGMKSTASRAIGLSGDVAGTAMTALSDQSANTMSLLGNIFQYAKASSANSQGTAMQALGLANNSTAAANLASSDMVATASRDKKTMLYVMAAGGVLLAILILKK